MKTDACLDLKQLGTRHFITPFYWTGKLLELCVSWSWDWLTVPNSCMPPCRVTPPGELVFVTISAYLEVGFVFLLKNWNLCLVLLLWQVNGNRYLVLVEMSSHELRRFLQFFTHEFLSPAARKLLPDFMSHKGYSCLRVWKGFQNLLTVSKLHNCNFVCFFSIQDFILSLIESFISLNCRSVWSLFGSSRRPEK